MITSLFIITVNTQNCTMHKNATEVQGDERKSSILEMLLYNIKRLNIVGSEIFEAIWLLEFTVERYSVFWGVLFHIQHLTGP